MSHQDYFSDVYARKLWSNGSGVGSNPKLAQPYLAVLQDLLKRLQPRRVLDLGCGDGQLFQAIDWGESDYLGVDVVPHLVEGLQKRFGRTGVRFLTADATVEWSLPEADLLICKDVLQHWLPAEVAAFVPRLDLYPRALITNDWWEPGSPWGKERWRAVDLTRPPYNRKGELLLRWKPRPTDPEKLTYLFGEG